MAKIVRVQKPGGGWALARQGGKLVTDENGAPCCCDGNTGPDTPCATLVRSNPSDSEFYCAYTPIDFGLAFKITATITEYEASWSSAVKRVFRNFPQSNYTDVADGSISLVQPATVELVTSYCDLIDTWVLSGTGSVGVSATQPMSGVRYNAVNEIIDSESYNASGLLGTFGSDLSGSVPAACRDNSYTQHELYPDTGGNAYNGGVVMANSIQLADFLGVRSIAGTSMPCLPVTRDSVAGFINTVDDPQIDTGALYWADFDNAPDGDQPATETETGGTSWSDGYWQKSWSRTWNLSYQADGEPDYTGPSITYTDSLSTNFRTSGTLTIERLRLCPPELLPPPPAPPLPPGLDENGQPELPPGRCAGCGQ